MQIRYFKLLPTNQNAYQCHLAGDHSGRYVPEDVYFNQMIEDNMTIRKLKNEVIELKFKLSIKKRLT